ncbi:MAG: cytochrome c oxidase subunit II [Candidatus Acidiferrales bacterium]
MRNHASGRGSASVAALFALLLVILTFSTIYFFAARTWWFPESVSPLGQSIDQQFTRTLWITGLVFLLSQLGLAFALVRYRDRGGRAHYSHGNNTLEALWTAATLILFVGLGIAAENAWVTYHAQAAAPNALVVEITGQQFQWNFRYPGPDGQFGRIAPEYINDGAGNFVGLDPNDPAAKDDLVVPTMAVPVNREVVVLLKAKDVTHSFFVRELRFKQDTVPGLVIRMHFMATKVGEYEVTCAELCGLGHHRMRTVLKVLEPAEYERWLVKEAAP